MDLRAEPDFRHAPRKRGRTDASGNRLHHRHTRMVGLLKVVFPAVAVGLLALVAAWPQISRVEDGFRVGFADLSPSSVESLSMVNARFHGIDNRNNPFAVTADKADEQDPQGGVVILDNPKADFVSRSGAGVYVESQLGVYHQKEQILELEGEINLFHDQGYELHTERARINLVTGDAEGHEKVTGNGPQGLIDGNGFRMSDEGKRIMVLGQSGATLKGPGGAKGAGKK